MFQFLYATGIRIHQRGLETFCLYVCRVKMSLGFFSVWTTGILNGYNKDGLLTQYKYGIMSIVSGLEVVKAIGSETKVPSRTAVLKGKRGRALPRRARVLPPSVDGTGTELKQAWKRLPRKAPVPLAQHGCAGLYLTSLFVGIPLITGATFCTGTFFG